MTVRSALYHPEAKGAGCLAELMRIAVVLIELQAEMFKQESNACAA